MSHTNEAVTSGVLTVREFIDHGSEEPVYIHTAWGYLEVSHVRWPETDPWVVCPKANGGFGQSFCVHYGVKLYTKAAIDAASETE